MGPHKLDAMTRVLEVEDYDGVIVFVRTKAATEEIADKLKARGYTAAAINGDIPVSYTHLDVYKRQTSH